MNKFPSHLFIETDVALTHLSTFRIGGKARYLIRATYPDDLVNVTTWAKSCGIPFRIFAGGSNIVFPDEGMDGLLIQVTGGNIVHQGENIIADAGIVLGDVIKLAISKGLSRLESLSGIPGTVGGAVVGNAGAYGHSVSEAVETVEVWDGKKIVLIAATDCRFSYRESIFKHKDYVVLRVHLIFHKADSGKLNDIYRNIISQREKKYKPGLKCPGSFFKNVLVKSLNREILDRVDTRKIIDGKLPAGYLLDSVGARGSRIGGIEIAATHGNLFVNTGRGTAKDVKKLAQVLKNKVWKKFGITLEEEIRYF
jgi:UDP-N-acetylmuramate dehydrogenase